MTQMEVFSADELDASSENYLNRVADQKRAIGSISVISALLAPYSAGALPSSNRLVISSTEQVFETLEKITAETRELLAQMEQTEILIGSAVANIKVIEEEEVRKRAQLRATQIARTRLAVLALVTVLGAIVTYLALYAR